MSRNMTLLQLVNELCQWDEHKTVTSVDNPDDLLAKRMVTCINRASEDIGLNFNWIWQLRKAKFTANAEYNYDDISGGYDLQGICNGLFDRFTTRYLYDETRQQIIPETQSDSKEIRDIAGVGSCDFTRFIRMGDSVVFSPEIKTPRVISFYYQTSAVCYSVDGNGVKEYKTKFERGSDISILDSRLLLRGALVKFKTAEGFDNAQELADYSGALTLLQDSYSPKTVIYSNDVSCGYLSQVTDYGL